MPTREAWRTVEDAGAKASEYFGAEHWALIKRLYADLLKTRADGETGNRLSRVLNGAYHLWTALDVAAGKVSGLESALAGVGTDAPEADAFRKLLTAANTVSAEASRLSADLRLAVNALDPAFERIDEARENLAVQKIGATGRAALLRCALDFSGTPRRPRAWAFAGIALRIDRKCRNSDEFRELTGNWRREIRRIERKIAFEAVHD